MILCICNNIREQDIKKQPELANLIGSCCGRCLVKTSTSSNSTFMTQPKTEFVEACNRKFGRQFNSGRVHRKAFDKSVFGWAR